MKLRVDFRGSIGYFNLNSERGLAVNFNRDWRVALVCAFMLLAVVFALDVLSLLSVDKKMGEAVIVTKKESEIKVNDTLLKKVLADIDARKEVFDKNFTVPAPVIATTTPAR